MKILRSVLLFLVVFNISSLSAQELEIKGRVSDSKRIPVEFATIILRDARGHYLKGAVTDSSGIFMMEIPRQFCVLHLSHIGYHEYSRKLDLFNSWNSDTLNIVLADSVNALAEVGVEGKKPLIKREIDRIVLDAGRLNTAASNFLDVLRTVPGVIVSDDQINMIGKGKIIFLMNDREIRMDGVELISYLRSLSSENLSSVEMMTTPPAKYIAEGNAGIINFVTKKRQDYFGGTLSEEFSMKKRGYNRNSASLQYNKGKIGAYADLSWGMGNMFFRNREYVDYSDEHWNTDRSRVKSNDFFSGTGGLDYALGKNMSVGMIASYFYLRPNVHETGTTDVENSQGQPVENYTTELYAHRLSRRYNTNLHFDRRNIGHDGTMKVDVDYLKYKVNDRQNLNTMGDENFYYTEYPSRNIDIYSAKVDFEFPFSKGKTTFGTSYSYTNTDSRAEYEQLSLSRNLNDHFVYKEDVAGIYADADYRFSKCFEGKLGLRGEYGYTNGQSFVTNTKETANRFDLFPTAYLSYSWSEDNVLSLSASGRIMRPEYSDMDPFVYYIDAHHMTTGNPSLQPEKSYNLDLGYSYKNLSFTGSYMLHNWVIGEVTVINQNARMTNETVDNMMRTRMLSFDVSYYFDRLSWFDCNFDGEIYHYFSKSYGQTYTDKTHQNSVFLYLDNNIYFNRSKTFMCNFWLQYNSKQNDVEGEQVGWFRMDLGLKYKLLKKKLSLGVDIMNLACTPMKSKVVDEDNVKREDPYIYRIFKFSLAYNFGKRTDNKGEKSNQKLLDRL